MFREGLGRQTMASPPFGCEETELAIRAVHAVVRYRIVHEPSAVVPPSCAIREDRLAIISFVRRCLMEGRSKAAVSRSVGRHDALSVERRYVLASSRRAPPESSSALRRRRDGAALRRLAALFAGVGLACLGYLPRIDLSHGSRAGTISGNVKSHVPAPQRMRALDSLSMNPDVSVIVCTHLVERFGWLVECLDAVQRQSTPPLEVIVVVDGEPEIRRLLEEQK